jgi:hypothetical protein
VRAEVSKGVGKIVSLYFWLVQILPILDKMTQLPTWVAEAEANKGVRKIGILYFWLVQILPILDKTTQLPTWVTKAKNK